MKKNEKTVQSSKVAVAQIETNVQTNVEIPSSVLEAVKVEFPTFDPNFKELDVNELQSWNDVEFANYIKQCEVNILAHKLINKLTKRRASKHLSREQYLLLMIYNASLKGINVEQMYNKGVNYLDAKGKPSRISDGTIYARWNVKDKPFSQRGLMEITNPDKGEPVDCVIMATEFPSRPDSKFALKRKCNHENKLTLIRGQENLKDYLIKEGATNEMFNDNNE
jgi:hypothetical protein